ncbi:hypothetical protein C9374_011765 [Naegleria lovaniensis]|uniref:DUF4116 domain-containing protein n=1 Tax=Naegleria lovaniensis TaxID=51637 RepID=A0AA88KCI9_NAELO|nr:uncharacterized protein C9374_011765 [Naegleria lovaniensis]KAG2373880.1 hypothetical protein C9374_011765 [Naegleria lovaniensis]
MQEEPSPSLILIDFDPSFHPHVHFRYESLLKRKFQMQQQGMIKYLEYRHAILTNGPVHYHPSELAIFTNALSNMFLPVEFMNDKLFMMEFVERHGYGLQYGSHELQKDAQVIMEAYRKACHDEKNVQLCNRNNRELFVQHLQAFLPKESTQYQDLIMALSSTDQRAALNECTKVDNDREYAPKENVLPKTNDSLEEVLKQYTNPSDKQQRIEVLKILKQDGMALQYATEKFKQDFGTVKAAVRQNGNAFEYASRNVKRNKETVLFALNHGALFKWVDRELYNDRDIILKVAQQGQIVDFTHFRNDREIVLEVMKHHGKYLNNASDELRRDREVVLYAVKSHYSAFLYACHELKKDPEIALTAIAHLNTALNNNNTMDISDLTWCEKEICWRMIRAKYDHPLKYASQALLNDRNSFGKLLK